MAESHSQILRAANLVRELETNDFRVLKGIELGMRRYAAVPIEQISFYARVDKDETQYRIDKLHKKGILQRYSDLGYTGYVLISESYDVLALHALVLQDALSAVGEAIARGKESDVFYAKNSADEPVAIKIHRVGQNSFRKVRALRSYVQSRHHTSWLYIDRLSAEKEFQALQLLSPLQIETPQPLAQNRHIIVMNLIEGQNLATHPSLSDPQKTMDDLMMKVSRIFLETHMIHCDLSEYNILITPEEHTVIIDWPQWCEATHPNASLYLTRDISNIQAYFGKYYGLDYNIEETVESLLAQLVNQ